MDLWGLMLDVTKIILASIIGTFIGAYSAFKLDQNHKKNQENKKNFIAAKRTQFVLVNHYQTLHNIKKQALDEIKDDENRWILLKPLGSYSKYLQMDIDSLVYILDTEDANLLNELLVANDRFETAIGTLQMRNNVHLGFQKKLAEEGEKAFDDATTTILKDLTDQLYSAVDDSITTNLALFDKLKTFIKEKFPNERPLSREPMA